MAQKKSYSRYFIILNEDEKGYAIASDKLPTGYVKLEMKNNKCKVSYYVQNLKKETAPYYMILVLGKKDTNKLIRLGELNIDDYGRADVSYEYSSDNIADTAMDVENISGAAIVRMPDNNMKSVLCGFLTSDIPTWKDYVVVDPKNREEVEDKKEEDTPVSVFDKYEESIQERVSSEVVEVEEIQEKDDNIREEYVEDDNIFDDIVDLEPQEEPEELGEEYDQEYPEEELDTRHKHKNKNEFPNCKIGKFFNELAKGYEHMKDEIKEIKNCSWYKVPMAHKGSTGCPMHGDKYSVIYNPMVNYHSYIMPHRYYLVGYKFDKEGKIKYLVYGIPGSKSKKDQPFGGKTGFVTWTPSSSGKCEGYWLMFYDFRTSTILIPVK